MSSLSKGNFKNPFSKTSMTNRTPQFSYSVLLKPPSTEMCNTRLVLVLHHQWECLSSTSDESHVLWHCICIFQAAFLVKWLLKTFNKEKQPEDSQKMHWNTLRKQQFYYFKNALSFFFIHGPHFMSNLGWFYKKMANKWNNCHQ